ncbi:MAG TPA: plastocyanin/azurin family copper-binding protein [Solirubrobacteraceae bacterium]
MLATAIAALTAAAVVLPAAAGSETSPTVTAVNGTGIYAEQTHSWLPAHVTVGEGANVTFSNPTTVPHGVDWISTPGGAPSCSGVPVGTSEASSAPEWSGSCTFTQPGTYVFYCTVHKAAMSGTITVEPPASGAPATGPIPTTPTGSAPAGGGAGSGQQEQAGVPSLKGSPFVAGAGSVTLTANRRGTSLHGSVDVSAAGTGGRLQVDVLARTDALGLPGRAKRLRVGHLERASLPAGRVPFSVALDARARRALTRRGRLPLSVQLTLTAQGAARATVTRAITLRR